MAGLWLAGEVVNHVGIYGSKAAEGLSAFQRWCCFNVVVVTEFYIAHVKGPLGLYRIFFNSTASNLYSDVETHECLILWEIWRIKNEIANVSISVHMKCDISGVGSSKPILFVPLFCQFFLIMITLVTCKTSRSHLIGATVAELRRHLTNMNVIRSIKPIIFLNLNFSQWSN